VAVDVAAAAAAAAAAAVRGRGFDHTHEANSGTVPKVCHTSSWELSGVK